MSATAVRACAYALLPGLGPNVPAQSAAELIDLYGTRVTGEIQRLRINRDRRVFAVFQAGIGYIQCAHDSMPGLIYCEAQSADSWEALSSVLTPERVARLHEAGFTDPGRAPNYWKTYSSEKLDDASIARELLTILHDVYGYNGLPKLVVISEDSRR